MTITQQRVQIERIVTTQTWRSGKCKKNAEFQLPATGPTVAECGFFLCRTYPNAEGNGYSMQIRDTAHTPEVAGQVAIAIGMAIEWIAEQTLEVQR